MPDCTLAASSMLPAWAVLPIAVAALLVTAAHIIVLQSAPIPSRRRRIRTANGLLMMLITALLAFALGAAPVVRNPATSPDDSRLFLLVWTCIIALVALMILLAALDIGLTARIALAERHRLRAELRKARAREQSTP